MSFVSYGTVALALGLGTAATLFSTTTTIAPKSTPTGKLLAPAGIPVSDVGSFPCAMTVSPDGAFAISTNSGFREQLSVIRLSDKKLTDAKSFNKSVSGKVESLYFGLAWHGDILLVSRGTQYMVSRYKISAEGKLESAGADIDLSAAAKPLLAPIAGLAVIGDQLYAAVNGANTKKPGLPGLLIQVDLKSDQIVKTTDVGGYPYAVLAVGENVWVGSERDSVVNVVTPTGLTDNLRTGTKPIAMCSAGENILIANAESDWLIILNQKTKRSKNVLLRPAEVGNLPAATPMGVTTDGKDTAYVALADMNAIAVVSISSGTVKGYIPTGWYPTAVVFDAKAQGLLVANAKGDNAQNPNAVPVPGIKSRGQYGPNIIEGTVRFVDLQKANSELAQLSKETLELNHFNKAQKEAWEKEFVNPGVKHVIYVVKENRTYDQVFGDITNGNGDAKLCLFPREVTPNQHALAERFLLLDNFHVCGEVSYDGWAWSTQAFGNEFTQRNAFNNYSRRRSTYDTEGQNGGVNPEAMGVPDIAKGPGGYIWESMLRKGLSIRNYGVLVGSVEELGEKEEGKKGGTNTSMKKALAPHTDTSFRNYDLSYADSDLWVKYGVNIEKQLKAFGKFGSTSRIAEWQREFADYAKKGSLPSFSLLRLPRNHTSGSAAGQYSARAMVADNDFAVGTLVETLSKSPFWKDTVICVLEDDAQAGYDHIDCHRSPVLLISPFLEKGKKDSKFYNTCSMIRTMGLLLGASPLNAYDGFARPINALTKKLVNLDSFSAILPAKEIATEINTPESYRAADSARLINRFQEESISDIELNDILWGTIKGAGSPRPPIRNRRKADADDRR